MFAILCCFQWPSCLNNIMFDLFALSNRIKDSIVVHLLHCFAKSKKCLPSSKRSRLTVRNWPNLFFAWHSRWEVNTLTWLWFIELFPYYTFRECSQIFPNDCFASSICIPRASRASWGGAENTLHSGDRLSVCLLKIDCNATTRSAVSWANTICMVMALLIDHFFAKSAHTLTSETKNRIFLSLPNPPPVTSIVRMRTQSNGFALKIAQCSVTGPVTVYPNSESLRNIGGVCNVCQRWSANKIHTWKRFALFLSQSFTEFSYTTTCIPLLGVQPSDCSRQRGFQLSTRP